VTNRARLLSTFLLFQAVPAKEVEEEAEEEEEVEEEAEEAEAEEAEVAEVEVLPVAIFRSCSPCRLHRRSSKFL